MNVVQGWRREEEGWVRVRSVMDIGCRVSVASPGMCPTYPIKESNGSRHGQEFMSASENTMPNLGEQKLGVVFDNGVETMIKYQIADVSRALNSITKICDAGHPDFGNHLIFGRLGGMFVNLETGKTTHFQRENNIYCLEYWVKPFSKAGNLNERADVWRYPESPSTDDVDADVKDEDESANTVAAKDANVMGERGNEEDIADEQSNVPPGPAIEEEEARIPTIRRLPREPTGQEIDVHHITHLPLRSWCVKGKMAGGGGNKKRFPLLLRT